MVQMKRIFMIRRIDSYNTLFIAEYISSDSSFMK